MPLTELLDPPLGSVLHDTLQFSDKVGGRGISWMDGGKPWVDACVYIDDVLDLGADV
jgi:hypothetical protein